MNISFIKRLVLVLAGLGISFACFAETCPTPEQVECKQSGGEITCKSPSATLNLEGYINNIYQPVVSVDFIGAQAKTYNNQLILDSCKYEINGSKQVYMQQGTTIAITLGSGNWSSNNCKAGDVKQCQFTINKSGGQ